MLSGDVSLMGASELATDWTLSAPLRECGTGATTGVGASAVERESESGGMKPPGECESCESVRPRSERPASDGDCDPDDDADTSPRAGEREPRGNDNTWGLMLWRALHVARGDDRATISCGDLAATEASEPSVA